MSDLDIDTLNIKEYIYSFDLSFIYEYLQVKKWSEGDITKACKLYKDYIFLFNWFYYASMLVKLFYSLVKNLIWKNDFGGARKPG